MSKKQKSTTSTTNGQNTFPGFTFVKKYRDISAYTLKRNNLHVLYRYIPDTGVVTSNITYRVGARDEQLGQTGLAHMLEHMLFKPTAQDLQRGIDSSAMQFERDTGCILNANTWKDRTTYYFSYPSEYFDDALRIEAERMQNVVLSDKEFLPERDNVLSEFDMYFGDPEFAIGRAMINAAFMSHPYGHETIGFREDIEDYTTQSLQAFYEQYYRPDNTTLTIVGNIDLVDALHAVKTHFGSLQNPSTPINRTYAREPKQEGLRRTQIVRPTQTNVLALGVKHAGFPSQEWFMTAALLSILCDAPDGILHAQLVDTGLASSMSVVLEPTAGENLAVVNITLTPKVAHEQIEQKVRAVIQNLQATDIAKRLKKEIQKTLTEEAFMHSSSLQCAMELTEYIAVQDWEAYFKTEQILKRITPEKLITHARTLFTDDNMTIGHFIGKV